MGIGLERELVGRFNTYLHTNEYNREILIKILKESTISPIIGFRKLVESKGKKLVIDEDVYGLIADQAYKLNTGARSLQTIMNSIRSHFLKEILRGTSDTIYLDYETVSKIIRDTMSRKGRV
jgi:ATP-dependent protease Clp ATPase subunit